jgi:hypothetical protein
MYENIREYVRSYDAKAPHEPSQLVSWLELFKLSQAKP